MKKECKCEWARRTSSGVGEWHCLECGGYYTPPKPVTVMTFMVGDLLHVGHLRLLERAKKLGDRLIVGVASDYAVEIQPKKKLKPVINEDQRREMVAALKCVDEALLYPSNEFMDDLIKALKPDIVCRGDDWLDFPGKEAAESIGAKIIYLPRTEGVSSTEIKRSCYDEWRKNAQGIEKDS